MRHTRKLIIESGEKDPLLWEADLPPKHPDYLRHIPVAKYDAQFTKDAFKVYDKGITRPFVRRYALVLPLTAGPSQVIPIPFTLDTGAPEFVYLCTSAALALTGVGALTQTTQRGHEYQLHGILQCPGDVELYSYERVEPHDIRLNLLGIKAIDLIIPDSFWLDTLNKKTLGDKDRTAGIHFLPMIKN